VKMKPYSLLVISVVCALLFASRQAVASGQAASRFEQGQYSSILPSSDKDSAANLYFGERFPLPKALVPNVDFWISVYSRYTTGQWILHDSGNLGIVYGVINADQLFPGENLSSRKVDKYIKNQKKHVASLLKKIYKNKGVAVNAEEAAIANALPERLDSYSRFLQYYKNVRAQRGQSDRFREGIERSGQHLARMRQVFRQYGLPEELTTLPHVESSFYYKAYSKAGAAGIWQFTRGTGRNYMRINYLVDERRDPVFSTHAAAKLLLKNYQALGSWPLAITAYNHGLNGMKRAVSKHGADLTKIIYNHKSRYFGFASSNFYAEFLAALEVSRNHIKYFGPVDFNDQVMYDEIVYGRYIHAKDLSQVTNLSLETLKILNPSLSRAVWDGRAKIPSNFKLKVPEGMGSFALIALEKAPSSLSNDSGDIVHKVRRGETISAIALHYGVAMSSLLDTNNIKPRSLSIGSKILVPSPTKNLPARNKYREKARKKTPTKQEAPPLVGGETGESKTSAARNAEAVKPESSKSAGPAFLVNSPVPLDNRKNRGSSPMALAPQGKPPKSSVAMVSTPGTTSSSSTDSSGTDTSEPDTSAADVVAQVLGRDLQLNPKLYSFKSVNGDIGVIVAAPEESAGLYADWTRTSVRRIREMNGGLREIKAGQKVKVPLSRTTTEKFESSRLEFYKSMLSAFLEKHSVDDEKQVVVKNGKSIWKLCVQEHNTPLWLAMLYNPGKEIRWLLPGDTLTLPTFSRK